MSFMILLVLAAVVGFAGGLIVGRILFAPREESVAPEDTDAE